MPLLNLNTQKPRQGQSLETPLIVHPHARQSQGEYTEAVSKALEEAPAALDRYEAGVSPHAWQSASLATSLDETFWSCPICANNTLIRLQKIEREGAGWAVTIQGEWVAKVVLSDKFEVLSVTKETQ